MALTQDWRLSCGDAHTDVQAENWLAALAAGLPAIGFDLGGLGRLVCATEADGSAVARDPRTGQEVRVVPLGVPVPPSFEMPISSFATVAVPQHRAPPSGDTVAGAREPAVRRIAPTAHFPSAMPRPPGAGKPREAAPAVAAPPAIAAPMWVEAAVPAPAPRVEPPPVAAAPVVAPAPVEEPEEELFVVPPEMAELPESGEAAAEAAEAPTLAPFAELRIEGLIAEVAAPIVPEIAAPVVEAPAPEPEPAPEAPAWTPDVQPVAGFAAPAGASVAPAAAPTALPPSAVPTRVPEPAAPEAEARAPRVAPPPRLIPPPAAAPTVEREGPGRVVRPAPTAIRLEDRLEELFLRLGGILDAPDPAAACAVALRLANELIPCDAGAVLVRTRAGDALRFRAALGPAAPTVLDTTIPLDRGIAGFCFQLGLALTIDDAHADTRHYARVDRSTGYQTRVLLAAPVRADDGGVYGVLELLNPPRPFTADDLELASRVAATLGSYFQAMHQ